MTDVEIRPLTPDDDMDAQVDLGQRAFGVMTPGQRENWFCVASLRVRQGVFLGAFVAGHPAGAATFHDMRQWWQGRAVPMAGVASVKVAPEYRGKGIGKRLMTTLLDLITERGYPLSALHPATMPLYRALGWELAGGTYQAAIPSRSLRSLLPPDPAAAAGAAAGAGAAHAAAEVRRAGPGDAAAINEIIGRAHQAARDSGPLTWDLETAACWLSREDVYAYLTGDGFAAYRWDGGNDTLFVERVHGATPGALRALWSVIASHASIAHTVRALIGPADPFWWLTHERDASITNRSMWMLRVVDAPAAIAARGFPSAVSATVPLVIADRARPANSGRWELTVSDGKGMLIPNEVGILADATGSAAAAGQAPGGGGSAPSAGLATAGGGSLTRGGPATAGGGSIPLTLGARGLAALYAGTPVGTLRLAGLASGGSPDDDAALDAAFAATAYMVDEF